MSIKITSYKIIKYDNVLVASLNNGFLYIIIDYPNCYKGYRPPLENCIICKNLMGTYIVTSYENDEQVFSQTPITTKEEMEQLVKEINDEINNQTNKK